MNAPSALLKKALAVPTLKNNRKKSKSDYVFRRWASIDFRALSDLLLFRPVVHVYSPCNVQFGAVWREFGGGRISSF